ncbi:MAG: glycosyltransferase family 4 protein [Verrucomicrobiales bacterium]|nr:glycosyltransferase family 4 protein [Verrucomicrobiales bacterium]
MILHLNNSHMGRELLATRHELWGQINDYENTDCYRRFWWNLRNYGLRRTAALARRRWIESRLVCRQDLTICNSRYTRSRVLSAYAPPHSEQVTVVYKAVDLDFFRRPLAAALPPDPAERNRSDNRIIFLGSDFVRKGLDLLVRAFVQLRQPADLTIVGVEEQEFSARYRQLGRALGSQSRPYRFMGRQPRQRVRELLWHSDVFALPTRAEALGVAILEAVAAGLWVVACGVGGVPEVIEVTPNAASVAPSDADAVRRLLDERNPSSRDGNARSASGFDDAFSKSVMLSRVRSRYLGKVEMNAETRQD